MIPSSPLTPHAPPLSPPGQPQKTDRIIAEYWAGEPLNQITYGRDFGNADWNKTRISVLSNLTTAPDGTRTADKLTVNAASVGGAYVSQAKSVTAGAKYKATIFLQKGSGHIAYVVLDATSNTYGGWFDLSNGTLLTTKNSSADWSNKTRVITDVGNGWYRIEVGITNGVTASITTLIAVTHADNSVACVTGEYLNAWGGQFRTGQILPLV
jgi:hypothetical protein